MEFKSKPYRLYEIRGGGADESATSQRSMHSHKTWSAGMHDGTLGSCLMEAVEDAMSYHGQNEILEKAGKLKKGA